MAEKVRFGAVDFTVFAVMLLLSAFIGIYHAFTGGRQRTTKEFLFANRGMMGIPVALSLLASFMSAITILGVPSEIYIHGTQYWLIIASYVILFPAVALVFVPVFRAVEISSSYEVGSRCSCTELQWQSAAFVVLWKQTHWSWLDIKAAFYQRFSPFSVYLLHVYFFFLLLISR